VTSDAPALAKALDTEQRARAEAERLRDEARQAARARDEFLAIASHELRNPLNALQLVLASMHRGAVYRPESCTPQWVDEKLTKAEVQLDRMIELVSKLLDVSRLSAGQLAL
jgi:signal transduction histidine kinase